jgi:hypothetical protein
MTDVGFKQYLNDNNLLDKYGFFVIINGNFDNYPKSIYLGYLKSLCANRNYFKKISKKYYIKNIDEYYFIDFNKLTFMANLKDSLCIYYLKKKKLHKAKYYAHNSHISNLNLNNHKFVHILLVNKKPIYDINLNLRTHNFIKYEILYFILKK